MKSLLKTAVATAAITLESALPALAQIDAANGVDFTTAFPFYVGNAKMPAGSYRITQIDINNEDLLVQSVDGKYSAFVDAIPTQAAEPHAHSDVTFHKYDNVEYLDRAWVAGESDGTQVRASKAELKAASTTPAVDDTVAGQ